MQCLLLGEVALDGQWVQQRSNLLVFTIVGCSIFCLRYSIEESLFLGLTNLILCLIYFINLNWWILFLVQNVISIKDASVFDIPKIECRVIFYNKHINVGTGILFVFRVNVKSIFKRYMSSYCVINFALSLPKRLLHHESRNVIWI